MTEPKHDFGIVVGSMFAYLIGMVPGFLIAVTVLDLTNEGAVLLFGVLSGLAIAAGFIKVATRIDLALFGPVTDSGEK